MEADKIKKLIDIAGSIKQLSAAKELERILARKENKDSDIVVPIIGEFSSGKTTLINALTDSKILETATLPTTATIFEIHFGSDSLQASYLNQAGELLSIEDTSNLSNEKFKDAVVVNLYDTSTKVSKNTILVDTPGLSSPVAEHKQTLMNFLPMADAILLAVDINAQVTRSLTDFIDTMKLSNRPIFLVITKCDTKTEDDVKSTKKYISENYKIELDKVACVSATDDNLNGLYAIFETIQKDKNNIVENADNLRLKNIANGLIKNIDELLASASSDNDLENSIKSKESELRNISSMIRRIVEDTKMEIEDASRDISRKFEDQILMKLDTLVAGGGNYDVQAVSCINGTASLLQSELQNKIISIIQNTTKNGKYAEKFQITSLDNIDFSQFSVNNLSYDLSLDTAGHEYDRYIAGGVKIAAVVGAIYAAGALLAGAGTAAAGTTAAAAGTGAATAGTAATALSVADTATDVASVAVAGKAIKKMNKMEKMAKAAQTTTEMKTIYDTVAKNTNVNNGMVESLVGLATESLKGKPARKRAIHQYLNNSLVPQFNSRMQDFVGQVVNYVTISINREVEESTLAQKQALEELKTQSVEAHNQYEQKVKALRDYKKELSTI